MRPMMLLIFSDPRCFLGIPLWKHVTALTYGFDPTKPYWQNGRTMSSVNWAGTGGDGGGGTTWDVARYPATDSQYLRNRSGFWEHRHRRAPSPPSPQLAGQWLICYRRRRSASTAFHTTDWQTVVLTMDGLKKSCGERP